MLLYIIRKLFSRRWTAEYLNFCLLKGHFTIYINPFSGSVPAQLLLQANVIISHKCVSADSNRRRKRRPRTVIVQGRAFTGLLLSAANFKKIFLPLQRTVTVLGRTSRVDYYCMLSTCFLQVLLVLVFTFF